jgi:hypothetical protein
MGGPGIGLRHCRRLWVSLWRAIDTIPRIAISACRTPASQGSAAVVEKMLPDRVSIGPRIPVVIPSAPEPAATRQGICRSMTE